MVFINRKGNAFQIPSHLLPGMSQCASLDIDDGGSRGLFQILERFEKNGLLENDGQQTKNNDMRFTIRKRSRHALLCSASVLKD
jgi:hypothetical protein